MLQDKFVRGIPCTQNAIDCFSGLWYSAFPQEFAITAGECNLFCDERLSWAFSHLQPNNDWDVLELGPLEGGHSYWLEKETNVKRITSIEANRLCWLRCLVTKEVVGLKKTQFLLGDFLEYLHNNKKKFDLALALGVLYHMEKPVDLLSLLFKSSENLLLWSQFAGKEQIQTWKSVEVRYKDFTTIGYVNDYGNGISKDEFIGGVSAHAIWLTEQGILDALKFVGYNNIITGPTGKNQYGGEITLVASRC
jgi:hypothetical protein